MEPRIQYAHTSDGVSIAFWTLGQGDVLISMPHIPWSHIELEWRTPEQRTWFEQLAERRTLVRYDCRGAGLSDRDVSDFSLQAHVRDLEAVVGCLRVRQFDLMANLHSGPAGIAYAAWHPQQVAHLLLWCAYARGKDYIRLSPQLQATRVLMDKDWELYTETMAHVTWGWSAGEQARRFAAFIRQAVTKDVVEKVRGAIDQFDVSDLLAQVQAPTLVLHRRQFTYPTMEVAKRLASAIPNARLALLKGSSPAHFLGDTDEVLAAMGDFLGVEFPPSPSGRPETSQPPLTIMFTDMQESTTLTQHLGDAKAQEVLHVHNRVVRGHVQACGGSLIKHTGDGIMASFPSVSRALDCAIAVQRALAEHNLSAGEPIHVRVGLNAGEPVAEEQDIFGTAVQLASRITAQAEPDQILVSDVVRQLVAGKGILFSDLGDVVLRGFEDPVRLYSVRWREGG